MDEAPPEPPFELDEMRFESRKACEIAPTEAIVKAVLVRSLLEPSGKTFFHEGEGRFIIVELKPTLDELKQWLSDAGAGEA